MYLEIVEVSRHESGLIYVLVNFWREKADFDALEEEAASEDFLTQMVRQYERIVRDINGHWKRLDSLFVDPATITPLTAPIHNAIGWERETITKTDAELRQEVKEHVLAYWRRAKREAQAGRPYPRKHDQRERMVRNMADPDGMLARLALLQGTQQEVVGE
jgi:hypothetical protein